MTLPTGPIGEPDYRPGEMDEDEARALLGHSMRVVNQMREQLGLPPLEWAEETTPEE